MASLRGLQPDVRDAARLALAWADYYGIPVRVTSGFRTCQEQARLRRRWLRGESPFPANRPGDSAHQYGLAFDSATSPRFAQDWTAIREWVGFNVPRNDSVHGEVPGWERFVGRRKCR